MRNATRISCHRRDDGSILAEYQPEDRMSLSDIEKCVEDMLDCVMDEGNHAYETTISPEIVTIQGIGTIAVLEIELRSSTICGRRESDSAYGLGADEIKGLMLRSARGWR